jgi:anti-sigma regulatory factor (Ser/Thr protein kinase)
VEQASDPQTDHRDVSLTIPARPEHLVLARLALSAVCRLTPLSPEEVADLKLAVTEAANDFVDETRPDDEEGRLNVSFKLEESKLIVELDGPSSSLADAEQELGRAIIEATVDEVDYVPGRTRIVKHLPGRAQG